jgi:hypothetical protein
MNFGLGQGTGMSSGIYRAQPRSDGGGSEKGRNMHDHTPEDSPGREGEHFEEPTSCEPCDEEELDPEEAERRITQFVTSANELPGPPVEELAEQVTALMRATFGDLETIMEGKAHNKVLATELLLSQRARGLQPHNPEQWQHYAASTLLSVLVIRGAQS